MALDKTFFEDLEARIPKGKVRTRFAPSPTGYMHVGNLRTALYTWLIARHADGTFILRIEDTDQGRLVEGATDVIYRTMKECHLDHDEGPDVGGPTGPYIQSERRDLYLPYAQLLVEKGAAYYCFCEKAESEEDSGEFDRADDPCRNLSEEEVAANLAAGKPYVIRQRIPHEGTTTFHDVSFGDITVENKTAYYRCTGKDAVFFYLGGYANRTQRDFLKRVYLDHPQLSFCHFGDIDAGGFYIHDNLCALTGIPFMLWHMSVQELQDPRFAGCLLPLTTQDRRRLNKLAQHAVYHDMVTYMLERGVKLEQEIVSYYLYKTDRFGHASE